MLAYHLECYQICDTFAFNPSHQNAITMLSLLRKLFTSKPVVPATQPAAKILQVAPRAASKQTSTDFTSTDTAATSPGENTLRFARLIMVTAENNNKFYEMKENAGGGTFTVQYGRVGTTSTTRTYPMGEWNSKLNEKLRKGYIDHTGLVVEATQGNEFAEIPDAAVRALMDDLMAYSRQSIHRNYNVGADQVTKRQVELAQGLLDQLVASVRKGLDINAFNEKLIELYKIIPRRMKKVQEHLVQAADTLDELAEIEKRLAEEQATLDVMRGQVEMIAQQKDLNGQKPITLLEAFGLELEPLTDAGLVSHIKQMMGSDRNKFKRAFKVTNLRTQSQFDQHLAQSSNKRVELFWHGSRNENWLSILKTGLVLRPANAVITGKMFGYGLYFADKCRKSLNYTSLSGSYWARGSQQRAWLALYDVHLGKPLEIRQHQSWCEQLTAERLRQRGKDYDSVFAKGGADLVNNEYIVYDEKQCTVRYMVEINA